MAPKAKVALAVSEAAVEWYPTVKDLPAQERPRERLIKHGASTLSTAELLAIILRGGVPGLPVTRLAEQLVAKYHDLAGLARAPISALCEERGLGEAKATQLKAALELGRRYAIEQPEEKYQVRSPADVAGLLMLEMQSLEQEQFRVLLLDTKNRVLAVRKLYEGSVNSSTIRIAEVFREAVRQNAPAIVAVHNHPSGDPTPSPEDVRVTEAIIQAGNMLDVDVLDHIVIGHGRFVSLKERGLGFR
jgi:DNA repair protein RadC